MVIHSLRLIKRRLHNFFKQFLTANTESFLVSFKKSVHVFRQLFDLTKDFL